MTCAWEMARHRLMLTAAHRPDESLEDAVFLAELLTDEFAGPVRVIEF
ncbi:hypothetical protein GGR62_002237 [Xanthomonas campestris]|nr:hypothetical protein [Xanthomonas sp. 3075]